MAEEKVEAPKRIWIPRATLDHGGGSIYIGQAWDDNDTEYVRVDHAPNTRQRAERAAQRIQSEVLNQRLGLKLHELVINIIAAEFDKAID